jgi:hypothetical protein
VSGGYPRPTIAMVTITYETPDGIDTITRDEYHADKDQFLTAYDRGENAQIKSKTNIPIQRVVRIDE